ncbi:fibronectin type III domain-containing protein [Flavobacterium sp. N502540]|uniref:fibronectin type III domain-containing protein n=1 Tax=Flavobacterium sp. N502540 TaxID=2986838 RepID=UPI002224E25D|nr:fibronectin type III domain-containing protein [Flavobacterium sp. N502540]
MDKIQLPKMLKNLHLYLLLLCSLVGFEGFAQTFPISVTTQITQPSPIYLSKYADATTINSPIKIQLLLNDLTISNRQVRLKIYFQGNGISFSNNDFVAGAKPLYLEGGFPLQLTNVDLAPYFQYQNLLGLNPNQYAQPLPEGISNFYVEVYDFATGKKLSRKTGTTTVIFQNEPPFLNLPLNNASIMQQNLQNIVFSWTPRSINVSNVEYEFSLVEIWDSYTPVQNAFAYSPPLYTTTTKMTTLQYGMSEPQLIPGKKYAWRIKAKAILGAEEIGVFKNNGYTEIFAFTYEVFCTSPLAIKTESISQDQAKISWSGNIDNFDYQVNYREKNSGSEWYKAVTPRENITLSNLKPNTTYEYTVGSSCDIGKYIKSSIFEFTTIARDEIVFQGCGIKPDPRDLANQTPLPELFSNDVVSAGDFPIVVLKATGSNGNFSGEGYVTLPFLEKFRKLIDAADALGAKDENGASKGNLSENTRIRITFNNIGVNSDFKLISGEIIAAYDPTWSGISDLDGVINDAFGDAGNVVNQDIQFPIKSVVKNPDGSITITGPDDVKVNLPKTVNDIIITDKNGKQYAVPANAPAGNIEKTGQLAPGGIPNSKNTNGMGSGGSVTEISSADVNVIFSKGNGFYAFDNAPAAANGSLGKTYETIPQKSGGTYNVNLKAISNSPNKTDIVTATANFKNGKTKKDLVFKTQNGTAIDSTQIVWKDNVATLTLKKTLDFAKETVIATVKPAASKDPKETVGKYDIAGAIDLWHLTNKKVNVILVSVNNASIPANAKEQLNAIYEPAGITFDVNTINVTLDNSWGESIETSDSDLLNTYTPDQQQITNNLKAKLGSDYKKDTYYVIYTGAPSDKSNILGFMPLKRQYGFIFNKTNTVRTLAHELGHGVFGLKHPFTEYNTTTTTDLLMDYGTGVLLSHNDWQVLHAPGLQLYPFIQGDSDGENVKTYEKIPYTFANLDKDSKDDSKGTVSFITPDGQIVSINHKKLMRYEFIYGSISGNEDSKSYNNKTKTGALKRFEKLEDDGKTIHEYVYDPSKGYVDLQDKKIYKDVTDFSKVDGFIYPLLNSNSNYAIFKLSFPISEHQKITQYNGGTGEITLDVFINKIAPYSSRFLNNLSKEISVSNNSCLWCYDQNTKNMLKEHFGKPEQLWINKIAEMRVVYPGFFDKFSNTYSENSGAGATVYTGPIKTTYKWYENFRVNLNDHTGWRGQANTYNFVYELYNSSDKQKYYEKYFQYFDTSLNEQVKNNNECLKSLFDPNITLKTINEEQVKCLKLATELEYQNLNSERAIALVKTLMQRNLWDEEEEKIIVKIIAYTKFNSNTLIDLLENDKIVFSWPNTRGGSGPATIKREFPLWYIIYLKINDSNLVISGDNRKLLMSVFYQHFLRSEKYTNGINKIIDSYKLKSVKELTEYLKKPEVAVTYDYKNIFVRGYADFASYLSSSTVIGLFYDYNGKSHKFLSIDAKYDEQTKKINVEQVLKEGLFKNESMSTKLYSPFDFMLFKNLSKDNLLTDYTANKDKDGKPVAIPVPAILSLYSSDVGDSQTQADIIQTSFDALTLAIPGGQLTKLGRVLFYADKISSVASMAGTAFREQDPKLANFFNKASLATGIVSIGDLVMPNNMLKISNEFEAINDAKNIGEIVGETQLNYKAIDIKNQSIEFAAETKLLNTNNNIQLLSKPTKELSAIQLEKNLDALKNAKAITTTEIELINNAILILRSEKGVSETRDLLTLLKKSELSSLNKEVEGLSVATKEDFLKDFAKADLATLRKLQDEKLVVYWSKWASKGIKGSEELSTISRIEKLKKGTFEAFESTVGNSTIAQRVKAYELWGDEKWDELYDFFHADPGNEINGGWPPFDGFIKIETVKKDTEILAEGGIFDRFQNPKVDKADGKITEVTELGGGFASPVYKNEYNKIDIQYTYDSRALLEDVQEGMVYIKFKIKDASGIEFSYGDAIPWKNKNGIKQQGLAKQIRTKPKFHESSFKKGITYDIVQRSVFRGGKWVDDIEDLTYKMDKIITKIDCSK